MTQHLPSPVKYREDINGLRSWAVIAVVLFHFSLIGLPGGFTGVDIFFVISGYLMTAIIVGGYQKENFSILKFYMARIRRIVPALIAVVTVLLLFGWFWLPSVDYQSLGKQALFGLSFSSNIFYWNSAEYFDSAAKEKWLLHTWSLAVEAQFYFLYPLFIAAIWKLWKSLNALLIGVTIIFFASLILNLFLSQYKPVAAFYLLPTRGWELAAGAIIFLVAQKGWYVNQERKNLLFWLGWLLLVVSFLFINEDLAWPSYYAIIPVLGTVLIIYTDNQQSSLLSNRLSQWIGDRSYSIYLWHWPFVVFLYFSGTQEDWFWVIVAILLSFMIAHLSYEGIEIPTRKYFSRRELRLESMLIGIILLIFLLIAYVMSEVDFHERYANQSPQAKFLAEFYDRENSDRVKIRIDKSWEKCNFFDSKNNIAKETSIDPSCISKRKGGVLLWGDSHAQALSVGIKELIYNNYSNTPFSQVTSSGCRAHLTEDLLTRGDTKKACDRSNRFVLKEIENNKPELVVIAQRNKHTENNLIEISETIIKLGVKKVLIIGPVPQWSIDLPRIIAKDFYNSSNYIKHPSFRQNLIRTNQEMLRRFKRVKNNHIHYIDIINDLCSPQKGCYAKLDNKNTPLVHDYGHLSYEGSIFVSNKYLSKYFDSIFQNYN